MKVPAIISDKIYVPFSHSIIDALHYVQTKFVYPNPDYANLKRLGKWLGSTPPTVNTWQIADHKEFGECLAFPRGGIKKIVKAFDEMGVDLAFVDRRLSLPPVTNYENSVMLRPDQMRLARVMYSKETCLIRSPTGSGKCLHPDTPVMMHDKSIRRAAEVNPGDALMGPNLTPKYVKSTTVGDGPLYKIIPHDGDPWICNKDHILTVTDIRAVPPVVENISLRYFLSLPKKDQQHYVMLRVDVENNQLYRWYLSARKIMFDVEYVGTGPYYGWTLGGHLKQRDKVFLLGDGTVTHNTEVGLKVAEWILNTAGPVLVIVWETGLMDQWIERAALRFGVSKTNIGRIGGSTKRLAPITIGMQQTLRTNVDNYTNEFGGVICDEVQRFAASTFQYTINKFPAKYRIGISASETRKDKKEYLIYDAFGKVMDEIDKETLILQERIMDVTIRIIPTDFDFRIKYGDEEIPWVDVSTEEKTANYNAMLDALSKNEERNNLLWHYMSNVAKSGQCLLVVSRRREHAKYIDARFVANGFASGLLLGGPSDRAEFRRTIEYLKDGRLKISVGTIQKSGVGHDIPMWNRGFIVTPLGTNKQLFEQMIGRLRRIHPGKKDAVCYYFWDRLMFPNDAKSIAKNYPKSTYMLVDDSWVTM